MVKQLNHRLSPGEEVLHWTSVSVDTITEKTERIALEYGKKSKSNSKPGKDETSSFDCSSFLVRNAYCRRQKFSSAENSVRLSPDGPFFLYRFATDDVIL
ncbi:hypothetical protein CDAR_596861 [Caerostris darwini]|uniref:Uncharacterized protein n=1 Tax=Caerostris darwini TaxID=1538125 RepID=A0AAV4WGQ1_9ARAC|nr:hypothetical protein CDAR_596861 [Caerostris darwini]